jgi:hypothetical protein
MPSSGSITVKHAYFISAERNWTRWCSTRTNPTRHIHHKANSIGSGHATEEQKFVHRIVESIQGAGAVLITGPANARTELVKHIHHHDPALLEIIAGVETVDHPSDGTLVAHARSYFKASVLMEQ